MSSRFDSRPTAGPKSGVDFDMFNVDILRQRKADNNRLRAVEFAQLRQWLRSTPGIKSTLQIGNSMQSRLRSSAFRSQVGALDKINELEAQFQATWQQNSEAMSAAMAQAPLPALNAPSTAPASSQFESLMGQKVVKGDALNPQWHPAALLFAQGQDAACEEALLALRTQLGAAEADRGLFAFYLATGRRVDHERLALAHAAQFQSSAPEWPVWATVKDGHGSTAGLEGAPDDAWLCPATLTAADVEGIPESAVRWDWHALRTLDASACVPLGKLWTHWMAAPEHAVAFSGLDQLINVLARATHANDAVSLDKGARAAQEAVWQRHLQLLRWLGDESAFESLALDFCVKFEVSPPAWTPPPWRLVREGAVGEASGPVEPAPDHGELRLLGNALVAEGRISLQEVKAFLMQEDALLSAVRWIDMSQCLRMDEPAAKQLMAWIHTHKVTHQVDTEMLNPHCLLQGLFEQLDAAKSLAFTFDRNMARHMAG